ncbi:MAG: glycosyltransferase family 39 protein [Chitinophagales bacterium]|nr:glycosyltransferase family 39 protein [Chitinophagales bacterium]
MNKLNSLCNIIVAGLFTLLVIRPLAHNGMFGDGLFYASVAKNLSDGIGTWWHPQFSKTLFEHFHEQPPLMIWLQSFFFYHMGDSIYPERIYSALAGVVMLLLIAYAWKQINTDEAIKKIAWLPQLLWLLIPTVPWGLRNNMIENTMVIFDWLSVIFIIQFLKNKKTRLTFILAVLFLFCASFTKGFQGLFPLAAPFCYWLSTQRISFKKMMITSVVLLASIGFIYFLLLQIPEASKSYNEYFASRFQGFPKTINSTTNNRLWLLYRLIVELCIPALLCLIIILLIQRKSFYKNLGKEEKSMALFFFMIALTASLPLMVTFEQRGFYLVTSMPFFAFALAIIAAPSIKLAMEKLSSNVKKYLAMQVVAWLLLAAGIFLSVFEAGNINRDNDQLHDVYLLKEKLGANIIVGTSFDKTQWSLYNYFMRDAGISFDYKATDHQYYLQLKSEVPVNLPQYQKSDLATLYVDVYEKVKN